MSPGNKEFVYSTEFQRVEALRVVAGAQSIFFTTGFVTDQSIIDRCAIGNLMLVCEVMLVYSDVFGDEDDVTFDFFSSKNLIEEGMMHVMIGDHGGVKLSDDKKRWLERSTRLGALAT